MTKGDSFRVRRSDDVAWVRSPARAVVLRLWDPALDPVVLDGSAAEIWDMSEVAVSLAEILDVFSERYAATVDEVRASVADFVLDCIATGLLVRIS